MKDRFRGFLPVVIDVETGGFNSETDALLEVAAVFLEMTPDSHLKPSSQLHFHIEPFEGANIEQSALQFLNLDPNHPFRMAVSEKSCLEQIFTKVQKELKLQGCNRAVLVGHNPNFDLSFLMAAQNRCNIKKSPFHSFTTFDTATLSGVALGHTVLAKALSLANIPFNSNEAHSAIYDAQKTAELFCYIVNSWDRSLK